MGCWAVDANEDAISDWRPSRILGATVEATLEKKNQKILKSQSFSPWTWNQNGDEPCWRETISIAWEWLQHLVYSVLGKTTCLFCSVRFCSAVTWIWLKEKTMKVSKRSEMLNKRFSWIICIYSSLEACKNQRFLWESGLGISGAFCAKTQCQLDSLALFFSLSFSHERRLDFN